MEEALSDVVEALAELDKVYAAYAEPDADLMRWPASRLNWKT